MKKDTKENKVSKRHKRLESVVKQFNTLFNTSNLYIEEQEIEPNRLQEFHPSSLPFCGLRDAYRRLVNGGIKTHKEMSMSSTFFTELGKVGHTVFQNWVSKAIYRLADDLPDEVEIEILGNWECIKCNHKLEFSAYRPCPKCKSDMQYVEITYHKPPLKLSLDKVLRIGKYYIPLDLKFTTSISIASYISRGMKLPYRSNKAQVRAYAALFEKIFEDKIDGGKVIGWILLYLARDNPTNDQNRVYIFESMTDEQKVLERRKIRRDIRHFKLSRSKRLNKAKLKKLIAEKPCKSKQDYDDNMHDHFNACELAACGDCFKPNALITRLKAEYKKSRSKGEKK